MLLAQLDMPTARYVCYAIEGFISYRIDAKRQYIEFEQSENISSGRIPHIDRRKARARIEGFFPFTLALFCLYMGLGLAHLRLTSQMRCSHLSVFFQILRQEHRPFRRRILFELVVYFDLVTQLHIVTINQAGNFKGEPLGIMVILHQLRFGCRLVCDCPCDRVYRKMWVSVIYTVFVCHFAPPFFCFSARKKHPASLQSAFVLFVYH